MVRSTTNKVLGKNDPEVWRQLRENDQARYARVAVLQEEKKDPVPLGPYPYYLTGVGWVKIHFMEADLKSGRVQYLIRGDYNLDVIVGDPEQLICVQVHQEVWELKEDGRVHWGMSDWGIRITGIVCMKKLVYSLIYVYVVDAHLIYIR